VAPEPFWKDRYEVLLDVNIDLKNQLFQEVGAGTFVHLSNVLMKPRYKIINSKGKLTLSFYADYKPNRFKVIEDKAVQPLALKEELNKLMKEHVNSSKKDPVSIQEIPNGAIIGATVPVHIFCLIHRF